MFLSLVPDLPALFRENIVGENHIKAMEGEVVRLGNTLEIFNKGGRIKNIRSPSLFERVH